MGKVIWKFDLEAKPEQQIEMPIGAEILSMQMQGDQARLWALVEPEAKKETRTFEVIGTGQLIPDEDRIFIGTYQVFNGDLVFHVFEKLKGKENKSV